MLKSLCCACCAVLCCFCVMTFLTLSGANEQEKPDVEYLNAPNTSHLPFSSAVRVGNMLYLSGELGTDYNTGKLVAGGIKPETKQTMDNIKATLERFGSSMDHVVKCTVMLADINEWKDFNEVYLTYFEKERLPSRSAFAASGLAYSARVEVECWAVMND